FARPPFWDARSETKGILIKSTSLSLLRGEVENKNSAQFEKLSKDFIIPPVQIRNVIRVIFIFIRKFDKKRS
ncbi:MAG: hypothetical protein DWP98_10950, partial [Bacteroidetes bacterium]